MLFTTLSAILCIHSFVSTYAMYSTNGVASNLNLTVDPPTFNCYLRCDNAINQEKFQTHRNGTQTGNHLLN
uniref:Hypotheticial protein n=1 Tax=Schistosoma japonicum TaxID=6182 RepID=C1LTR5_SCHJA|nr:hypotheticial protein [Schistosoma japonicum]